MEEEKEIFVFEGFFVFNRILLIKVSVVKKVNVLGKFGWNIKFLLIKCKGNIGLRLW